MYVSKEQAKSALRLRKLRNIGYDMIPLGMQNDIDVHIYMHSFLVFSLIFLNRTVCCEATIWQIVNCIMAANRAYWLDCLFSSAWEIASVPGWCWWIAIYTIVSNKGPRCQCDHLQAIDNLWCSRGDKGMFWYMIWEWWMSIFLFYAMLYQNCLGSMKCWRGYYSKFR